MNWPYIQYLFVTGVRETLVGKCQGAKNYQDDSGQRDCFHVLDFRVRRLSFVSERPQKKEIKAAKIKNTSKKAASE